MNYLAIIQSSLIYFFGNLIVWFQLNGQFKWEYWKDNVLVIGLLGVPISIAFWYATKLSYIGFDGVLWPGRLIAFGLSMISFTMCTWIFLVETLTLKTIISLILAIIIVLIQLVK